MIPLSKQSFTIWEASQGGGDLCPALLSSARVCRAPSAEEANATYVPCASLVSSCPGLLPGLALASLRLQKSAQTGLVLHFHPLGPLWVQAGCSGNQKQPSGLSHSLECRLEISGRATRSESKLPRRPPGAATQSRGARSWAKLQSDAPRSPQRVKPRSDQSSVGGFHCPAGAPEGVRVISGGSCFK